jgi:5-carboxymethyl-2-hydroxymuconate isomerase
MRVIVEQNSMPHLRLEYSSNIKERDFKTIFHELHQILVTECSANLESCKSRAVPYEIFYVGDGHPKNAFVHLEICLADGRPLKAREEAGKQMLEVLSRHFSKSLKDLNLQITVESKEFQRNLYFKIPAETV